MKTSIHKTAVLFIGVLFSMLLIQSCNDIAGPDGLSESDLVSENYDGVSEVGRFANPPGSGESCISTGEYELIFKSKSHTYKRWGSGYTTEVTGKVSYKIEGEEIKVTFSAKDKWKFTKTYLYISNSLDDLPVKYGVPDLRNMPYTKYHKYGKSEYTYTIPLSELNMTPGGPIYIVAQAESGKFYGSWCKTKEIAYAGNEKSKSKYSKFYYIKEKVESCSGWGKTE